MAVAGPLRDLDLAGGRTVHDFHLDRSARRAVLVDAGVVRQQQSSASGHGPARSVHDRRWRRDFPLRLGRGGARRDSVRRLRRARLRRGRRPGGRRSAGKRRDSDGSGAVGLRRRRRGRGLTIEPLQLGDRPFPLHEPKRTFGERALQRRFAGLAVAMREQQLAVVEVGFAAFIVVRRCGPRVGGRNLAEHLLDHRIRPVAARPGSGFESRAAAPPSTPLRARAKNSHIAG